MYKNVESDHDNQNSKFKSKAHIFASQKFPIGVSQVARMNNIMQYFKDFFFRTATIIMAQHNSFTNNSAYRSFSLFNIFTLQPFIGHYTDSQTLLIGVR